MYTLIFTLFIPNKIKQFSCDIQESKGELPIHGDSVNKMTHNGLGTQRIIRDRLERLDSRATGDPTCSQSSTTKRRVAQFRGEVIDHFEIFQ